MSALFTYAKIFIVSPIFFMFFFGIIPMNLLLALFFVRISVDNIIFLFDSTEQRNTILSQKWLIYMYLVFLFWTSDVISVYLNVHILSIVLEILKLYTYIVLVFMQSPRNRFIEISKNFYMENKNIISTAVDILYDSDELFS